MMGILNVGAIQKELAEVEQELVSLPDSNLYQRKNYFHYVVQGKEVGITRKPAIIRQLCRRAYLCKRQTQLMHNLTAPITEYVPTSAFALIQQLPSIYQRFPIEYFYHPSVTKWLAKPPRFNTLKPEDAVYTYQNINFRSLSEREIAQKLTENHLLYYYDATFNLTHAIISPDFYIKNPFTGKIYLWEHFGAFHRTGYSERTNDKMLIYAKIGFHENNNLMTTYNYHLRLPNGLQQQIDRII